MSDAAPRAVLVLAGRGDLVFEPLHGDPLWRHALRAVAPLGPVLVLADEADRAHVRSELRRLPVRAEVVTGDAWWDDVRRHVGAGLVVHDALCPLVDAALVDSLVARAAVAPDVALVGVRPVTDTLKEVVAGRIRGTVDREQVVTVCSPAVVPAALLAATDEPPPVRDLVALVAWLRARGEVELVTAPPVARRVSDAAEVRLLEAFDDLEVTPRTGAARPAPGRRGR